jgi:predicted RNase H-like HicB family nuclease
MIRYPARIEKYDEDDYEVQFVDLPTCFTAGDTLDDARAMAIEALTGVLESMSSRNIAIPEPSTVSGRDIYYIEPELTIAF